MGELWAYAFLSSCPPSILNTFNVHLACIKLSSTELKCKFSNKASCMTHPLPFFFLTSSLPALHTLFCDCLPPSLDTAQITERTTGGAAGV